MIGVRHDGCSFCHSAARVVAVAVAITASWSSVSSRADTLASGVYVRTDGDHTTVVSPHARVEKRVFDETNLGVEYRADIWTSASVDIRSSASRPVSEQRDELDLSLSQELTDLTLDAAYRYSIENDYVSHGAFAGAAYDFANKNAKLAWNGYALFDTVGRAGFPGFSEPLRNLGSRVSFTQILDMYSLIQLGYELSHLDGYQASPYRKVGFGGSGFGCAEAALCLDEHEPTRRTRHAAALTLRRALSDRLSAGLAYRFVIDDWGLSSHTAALQLAWLVSDVSSLTLRYRYYRQTGVSFYAKIYPVSYPMTGFTTRDREQSPMSDHRLGLDWDHKTQLTPRAALSLFSSVGAMLYDYGAFVGLSRVFALEVTFAVALSR